MSSYEGRALPRPEEDVVDQGLAFDLATVVDRRLVFRSLGLGAAALGLAACGGGSSAPRAAATPSSTGAVREIAAETAGPFPGDGSNGIDVLSDSGVVRGDITSSFGTATGVASGVPMAIELDIKDLANGGAAFAGAAVYVWHCDREGRYSLYSEGVTSENYLRGVQVADASGRVRFASIFPATYPGRWPHIHFEVFRELAAVSDSANAIATSQVALPVDVCEAVYATAGYEPSRQSLAQVSLQSDGVFGEDAGASQLATVSGSVSKGLTIALPVGVRR